MNNRITGVVLLIIVSIVLHSCKSDKNREIFEDFEGDEGIYMIKLPPSLFLGMVESESDTPINDEDLGNIEYVKVLIFDSGKSTNRDVEGLSRELIAKFDRYGYELALQLSRDGINLSAYMLDDGDHVSDLMIIFTQENNLFGLGLSGQLDGKGMMNFASDLDFNDIKEMSDFNFSF